MKVAKTMALSLSVISATAASTAQCIPTNGSSALDNVMYRAGLFSVSVVDEPASCGILMTRNDVTTSMPGLDASTTIQHILVKRMMEPEGELERGKSGSSSFSSSSTFSDDSPLWMSEDLEPMKYGHPSVLVEEKEAPIKPKSPKSSTVDSNAATQDESLKTGKFVSRILNPIAKIGKEVWSFCCEPVGIEEHLQRGFISPGQITGMPLHKVITREPVYKQVEPRVPKNDEDAFQRELEMAKQKSIEEVHDKVFRSNRGIVIGQERTSHSLPEDQSDSNEKGKEKVKPAKPIYVEDQPLDLGESTKYKKKGGNGRTLIYGSGSGDKHLLRSTSAQKGEQEREREEATKPPWYQKLFPGATKPDKSLRSVSLTKDGGFWKVKPRPRHLRRPTIFETVSRGFGADSSQVQPEVALSSQFSPGHSGKAKISPPTSPSAAPLLLHPFKRSALHSPKLVKRAVIPTEFIGVRQQQESQDAEVGKLKRASEDKGEEWIKRNWSVAMQDAIMRKAGSRSAEVQAKVGRVMQVKGPGTWTNPSHGALHRNNFEKQKEVDATIDENAPGVFTENIDLPEVPPKEIPGVDKEAWSKIVEELSKMTVSQRHEWMKENSPSFEGELVNDAEAHARIHRYVPSDLKNSAVKSYDEWATERDKALAAGQNLKDARATATAVILGRPDAAVNRPPPRRTFKEVAKAALQKSRETKQGKEPMDSTEKPENKEESKMSHPPPDPSFKKVMQDAMPQKQASKQEKGESPASTVKTKNIDEGDASSSSGDTGPPHQTFKEEVYTAVEQPRDTKTPPETPSNVNDAGTDRRQRYPQRSFKKLIRAAHKKIQNFTNKHFGSSIFSARKTTDGKRGHDSDGSSG